MRKLTRRLLWKSVVYLLLPALLICGGYWAWLSTRLRAHLQAEDVAQYTVSYELVPKASSQVQTGLSRVLRAHVKRTDGPNWVPSTGRGLIYDDFDWTPAQSEWIKVEPSLEALRKSVELRLLEAYTPDLLIAELAGPDPLSREAAVTLLRVRTKQSFGYRPDLDPKTQQEAITRWRAWWEANKISWTIEKAREILGK